MDDLLPQRFPLQITGWPVELMAYAYLAVSPPNMSQHFEEMAAAASNKNTGKKRIKFPELEERALQFILDSCESSISKYNKFLEIIRRRLRDMRTGGLRALSLFDGVKKLFN
ncbi:hypothetical protein Taro_012453 [Colocasia esculenta]|uniref:Rubisco LSMT substrate-binding domain-containing protein n=1 Tax=Colocasia esculenta TaxID=4460 RepID=A0A843UDJ9_COLES|nr:hypothetical protein [Colocasia esculenta]